VRKRVVIGVLAIIGAGVLLFALSQPKRGSVEWHKREYVDARMRLAGYKRSVADHLRRGYARITGSPPRGLAFDEEVTLRKKVLNHEAALLEMGFLAKREVTGAEWNSINVVRRLNSKEGIARHASGRFKGADISSEETNVFIELTAPSNDLPTWERLIRKADMPKNGN